ncbi:MAG: amidohydrolase family protein [Gemmatimonadota bacterium]|nr:amidohydrolase family protein [Gemmatimonadota bacterium]
MLRPSSWRSSLALTTVLTAGLSAPNLQAQDGPLYIVNASVIDGVADAPIRGATVVVDGRLITRVETAPGAVPEGARVIDAAGRYLLPGLMDAHSHLASRAAYQRALESGVTTVRTAGVGGYSDVAMGEMVSAGIFAGPDVLPTGVYVTPDIGDAVFSDPRLHRLAGEVRSLVELEHLVRVNIDRGARWIKTRGTERAGVPTTDPREQVYNEEQLRTIVETAAEHGVYVMAHAHGDSGIRAAVLAGVRSIEHGTYASEETLQLMKERGTWLVPTLSSISSFGQAGDYADPRLYLRGLHMAPRRRGTVRRAIEMGIPVVAGVDTSYEEDSFARVSREIGFLVDEGMSPMNAIRAATSNAARMYGIEDKTGSIRPGLEADLILVDQDPTQDIRSIQDILLVISNGQVAYERLGRIDGRPTTPGPVSR